MKILSIFIVYSITKPSFFTTLQTADKYQHCTRFLHAVQFWCKLLSINHVIKLYQLYSREKAFSLRKLTDYKRSDPLSSAIILKKEISGHAKTININKAYIGRVILEIKYSHYFTQRIKEATLRQIVVVAQLF